MSNDRYRRDRDYHRQSDYGRYNEGSRRHEKRSNDVINDDAYPDKRVRRDYEQRDFRRDTRNRGNDYDERNYNRNDAYYGRDRDNSRYSPSVSSHEDLRERDRHMGDSDADFSRNGKDRDSRSRYEGNERDDGKMNDSYNREYSDRFMPSARRDEQGYSNGQRYSYGRNKYNQRGDGDIESRDQRSWTRDQGRHHRGTYDTREDDEVSPRGISNGNSRTRQFYRQGDNGGSFGQDRACEREDFSRRGGLQGQNRNHGGYYDERRIREDRAGRDSRRGFDRGNENRGNGGRNQDRSQREAVMDAPHDGTPTDVITEDKYYEVFMKHITKDVDESWWDVDGTMSGNAAMETS